VAGNEQAHDYLVRGLRRAANIATEPAIRASLQEAWIPRVLP
jgi:hypothetical protein